MAEAAGSPGDVEAQVQRVTAELKRRNDSGIADEVIERAVRDSFAERADAKVKDFVSLLAEHAARDRLRRIAPDAPQPATG